MPRPRALIIALTVAGCTSPEMPAPADFPPPLPQFECALDDDCDHLADSGTPCRRARCVPGARTCELVDVVDGVRCDDGDACTAGDRCAAGRCGAGEVVVCDDGNACTSDRCDEVRGCLFAQHDGTCDDGDPCTTGDRCRAGRCVALNIRCPCTDLTDCAPHEDGDLCNGQLACTADGCALDPNTIVDCGAEVPCQSIACAPATGRCEATAIADGTLCDDADPCSDGDACTGGVCRGGAGCDDGSPCTDDVCSASSGCLGLSNGTCGDCIGLACHRCSFGSHCGGGAPIGNTCCSEGDAIDHLSSIAMSELVDVEVDDMFAYACGGFGVRIARITSPTAPLELTDARRLVPRCQRAAVGPRVNRRQIFWVANHGDSWASDPFLVSAVIDLDDGSVMQTHRITDPTVLFEGLLYHRGHLYVAAHAGGLRVYTVDPSSGAPTLLTVVGGFTNAWKVAIEGDHAFVADGGGGLRVVDIRDPAGASIVASIPTHGLARDVDVAAGRAFVALGGDGVDVFDVSTPSAPTYVRTIETQGSAQAVDADGDVLAVAAWSHVAVHDVSTYQLLATEDLRLYPSFDQVFGVATRDGTIYAAEWVRLHVLQHRPGEVGPDISVDRELQVFAGDRVDAAAIVVRNRGQTPLDVGRIRTDLPSMFSLDKTSMTIPPGGADVLEVTFTPPGGSMSVSARLVFETNDPDAGHSPFEMFLVVQQDDRLNVGDRIDQRQDVDFGFLDPTGANQVENLRGHVVVLAYFALF